MIKNLYLLVLFVFCSFASSHVYAEIQYEINDIGTLQTQSSEAIALNNQGQILGWYNVDGSSEGKHFFLRNKDGAFLEIPRKTLAEVLEISWNFLTDEGTVFGTFPINGGTGLCQWDSSVGFVNLGIMPGRDIVAVNNAHQVLIKEVAEKIEGKMIIRPVIWHNGTLTRLHGLRGAFGIESDMSYGLDLNNKGEVVGESILHISHKNKMYKQVHATKWVNGETIDLHQKIPKSIRSKAIALNDSGDILIEGSDAPKKNYYYYDYKDKFRSNGYVMCFIGQDKGYFMIKNGDLKNITNSGFVYNERYVIDKNREFLIKLKNMNNELDSDPNSIWIRVLEFTKVNDKGEIIAQARTIYGELHAILLTPVTK